jgi:hypothetical protein
MGDLFHGQICGAYSDAATRDIACTDNAIVSPWGQAFSLLADVAAFPRKALTDSFFLRGLKVPEDDLIEAMNVANDVLLRNLGARGIKDRCKAELNLLMRIKKAPMESRERCELVCRILNDNAIDAIDEILKAKEANSQKAKAPPPGPSGSKGVVAPEGEKGADEFGDAFSKALDEEFGAKEP